MKTIEITDNNDTGSLTLDASVQPGTKIQIKLESGEYHKTKSGETVWICNYVAPKSTTCYFGDAREWKGKKKQGPLPLGKMVVEVLED